MSFLSFSLSFLLCVYFYTILLWRLIYRKNTNSNNKTERKTRILFTLENGDFYYFYVFICSILHAFFFISFIFWFFLSYLHCAKNGFLKQFSVKKIKKNNRDKEKLIKERKGEKRTDTIFIQFENCYILAFFHSFLFFPYFLFPYSK